MGGGYFSVINARREDGILQAALCTGLHGGLVTVIFDKVNSEFINGPMETIISELNEKGPSALDDLGMEFGIDRRYGMSEKNLSEICGALDTVCSGGHPKNPTYKNAEKTLKKHSYIPALKGILNNAVERDTTKLLNEQK